MEGILNPLSESEEQSLYYKAENHSPLDFKIENHSLLDFKIGIIKSSLVYFWTINWINSQEQNQTLNKRLYKEDFVRRDWLYFQGNPTLQKDHNCSLLSVVS